MKLYDMLDVTLYHQEVWIFETDAYDKNMPIFKGTVDEARKDDYVWDYLQNKIDHYECNTGILVIFAKSSYFKEGLENNYTVYADEWGKDAPKRPWRYSAEINRELKERIRR